MWLLILNQLKLKVKVTKYNINLYKKNEFLLNSSKYIYNPCDFSSKTSIYYVFSVLMTHL